MADPLAGAVRALRAGRLVVYPTDTLFGLGALAGRSDAVARLLEVKRRPSGQPISVAVSSTEELEPLVLLSESGRAWVRRSLPGPFTALVKVRPDAPLAPELLARDGTIGIRVPDHPLARRLTQAVGPVTATSANRHGEPNPGTLVEARRVLGGEVAAYLSEGPPPSGRPSQLMDLTGTQPRPVARRASPGRP
jgi:L-threonylcarbamoyladenylate synthase